ncbi:MAG TPA: hypothetical protein VF648_07145 [Pyrinomonadaceae bacterium]|jgi:hypothetical protein
MNDFMSNDNHNIELRAAAGQQIGLLFDLQNNSIFLPADSVLTVKKSNSVGVLAVDDKRYLHVISHSHHEIIYQPRTE